MQTTRKLDLDGRSEAAHQLAAILPTVLFAAPMAGWAKWRKVRGKVRAPRAVNGPVAGQVGVDARPARLRQSGDCPVVAEYVGF